MLTNVVDDDPAVAEAAVGAAEEGLPVRQPRHGARRARVVHPVAVVSDGIAEAEQPREAAATDADADDEDRAGGDNKEPCRRGEKARSRHHHRITPPGARNAKGAGGGWRAAGLSCVIAPPIYRSGEVGEPAWPTIEFLSGRCTTTIADLLGRITTDAFMSS